MAEIRAIDDPETTKADEIGAALERSILFGELPPGTMLRQEQLAEQYGVSRTPIREALRRLDALGLVVFRPNRGVLVGLPPATSCASRSSPAPRSRARRPSSRRPGSRPSSSNGSSGPTSATSS